MRFLKIGLSMSLFHAVIALVVVLLLLIDYVDAKSGVIDHIGTATPFPAGHGIDELNSMLVGRNGLDTGFEQAKSIIQRLDNSPICAHLATKRLLLSCKSSKDPMYNHESAQSLDNAKTVYAIRHAICQLRGAKSSVDDACLSIERVASFSDSEIELVPESTIKECLNFLSKNHFWTSYSNSLQDASTLCDPARIDYQREELLNVYRELTNRLPNIVEAVETQMGNIIEFAISLDQHVHGITADFEEKLNTSMRESLKSFVSSFDQLQNNLAGLERDSSRLQMTVHQGFIVAENRTSEINDILIATQIQTSAMFSELMKVFHNEATGMASLLMSLLDPIKALLATGVLQQLHDSIKLSEHSISQFSAIQSHQTELILQQNAIIANSTVLSKKGYDHVLAMNEALEILHHTIAPIVQTTKEVVAGVSSFAGQLVIFFTGLMIFILFPRFKTIAICFVTILLLKALQFCKNLSLHIQEILQAISLERSASCLCCELGSYEYMVAVAGTVLIILCLLLRWAQKRHSRMVLPALPVSSTPTIIEGRDRVHLSKNMLVYKRAATVGPHF